MISVARDIWRIGALPFWGINAYLAGEPLEIEEDEREVVEE